MALRAFMDPTISAKLWGNVGQEQWTELLNILEPKLTSPADRQLMEAIRTFTATPDKLSSDSSIRRLVDGSASRRRGNSAGAARRHP